MSVHRDSSAARVRCDGWDGDESVREKCQGHVRVRATPAHDDGRVRDLARAFAGFAGWSVEVGDNGAIADYCPKHRRL